MSSQIEMIIPFPTEWENKIHVPVTTNQNITEKQRNRKAEKEQAKRTKDNLKQKNIVHQ